LPATGGGSPLAVPEIIRIEGVILLILLINESWLYANDLDSFHI